MANITDKLGANKPRTAPKVTFWEFFQSLGKTFMLPVALLAFSGILLGIGSSMGSDSVLKQLPFLDNFFFKALFAWMTSIGLVAFIFLPVMFAIAIPLGMAREDKGIAAFAGFVGFAAFNLAINFQITLSGLLADPILKKANGVKSVIGIETIDTGILGAVFVGIVVYKLHTKYRTIQLPDAFAFFGGARFVPIASAVVLGIAGIFVPFIWPIIAKGINGLGAGISGAGIFGPMLFGSGERLLIPFGLHHILVALIRFTEAGGVATVCGHEAIGALNIFYAELSCSSVTEFSPSATQFLSQGKMPSFLGGLPGAALAMYHCALPENRHKIKGLLISGVVACVIGGITEPLEFLFLFTAPILYLVHAFLTGLGFMSMAMLNVTIGNTDGNVIDFVVFGILQGLRTKWYFVPIVASIWFVIYYVIFRFAILRFNLKTPGRDIEMDADIDAARSSKSLTVSDKAKNILAALGGKENLIDLDNCITRLRLSVENMELVDDAKLKANGALGVIKLDAHSLQVVIGPQVHVVKEEISNLI